jgi:hypothetical protein
MRYHHTKNKGDLGLVQAMADLTAKGWAILVPLTEHEAFDLVAYRDGRFLRVQVKYRAAVNGVVPVPMKTCWTDRRGIHTSLIDRNAIDLFCVYCPDTERCYYLDPAAITGNSLYLRLAATKNNMAKGIRWARDFTEIPATVLGVPAGFGVPLERMPFVRHSREPRATWLLSAHSSAG